MVGTFTLVVRVYGLAGIQSIGFTDEFTWEAIVLGGGSCTGTIGVFVRGGALGVDGSPIKI